MLDTSLPYFVQRSWGHKFVGKGTPCYPQTLNYHEQLWFHSIVSLFLSKNSLITYTDIAKICMDTTIPSKFLLKYNLISSYKKK